MSCWLWCVDLFNRQLQEIHTKEKVEPNETNETLPSKVEPPCESPTVTRIWRMSTASNRLLEPIPFTNNTYQSHEYSCMYLENKKYQKKFTVDYVIHQLFFEQESSAEIFSIRDTAMSELIDFDIATDDQLIDLATKLMIYGWSKTLSKLYIKRPQIYAMMESIRVDAFKLTKRHSLLMAFPPDVASAPEVTSSPSSPPMLSLPSSPPTSSAPLASFVSSAPPSSFLSLPSSPPPPYEDDVKTVNIHVEGLVSAPTVYVPDVENQSSILGSPRQIAKEIVRPRRPIVEVVV